MSAAAPTRSERIRQALEQALAPEHLEVIDESHKHVGHAGARDGRGHFHVVIVSAAFEGMGALSRHRAVYEAMGSMMQTDIHALSMSAHAPSERTPGG